ncbi:MFS transporter [Lentzea flava]|uniref:MFS transporter n=1 Tax=Lentzea flava TaxID=103732 RepID=A0ABQ2UB52_9PSEU|nr:MFS transporter [Lentzea flava]MCP2196461.1 putative arabinose efflux permease, MFS family [Lentzea flava]GGU17664.1 MFS transporter [Lentzea flava]
MKILPLALAQFIASYAATNMNVAISTIAEDLGTTITGVQTTITLFTLVMAALMVPGSKLTDIWGRRRCFVLGLTIYGTGALLAAFAPGPGLLLVGYAIGEGVGSALMIPPIYILVTALAADATARAKGFGMVSGAGGLGAAAGPLLGGLITSTLSWRASFVVQVLVVAVIIVLARNLPRTAGQRNGFDLLGAVLSGTGLFLVVLGVLRTNVNGWGVSTWLLLTAGAVVLALFAVHIRLAENPLCDPKLFRDRTSNLGLGTQLVQWLVLQGTFFVLSVHLQQEEGLTAIGTGLALLPATIGLLATSALAGRLAQRHSQRTLIRVGFLVTIAGTLQQPVGLFLVGAGIGIMLTASVNVVQSRWPDADQADVSGVSRAVSNLGSSLGTALVGSVLTGAGHPYRAALTLLVLIATVGLVLALFIRSDGEPPRG